MTETLTHADIRKFFKNTSAAIELDQRRVDAMPPTSFHPMYDALLWRDWRVGHLGYIKCLLSSVNAISPAMLVELTKLATTYQVRVVERIVLETFADAVSGSCPEMAVATAEQFFGWVIDGVRLHAGVRQRSLSATKAIAKWLPNSDPLRIARDPECQYHLRETC